MKIDYAWTGNFLLTLSHLADKCCVPPLSALGAWYYGLRDKLGV
ncbi:hypothetical protein [Pseudomonas fluorescens]|nr:hypothetical protein [Pseudomonas fluorescens]